MRLLTLAGKLLRSETIKVQLCTKNCVNASSFRVVNFAFFRWSFRWNYRLFIVCIDLWVNLTFITIIPFISFFNFSSLFFFCFISRWWNRTRLFDFLRLNLKIMLSFDKSMINKLTGSSSESSSEAVCFLLFFRIVRVTLSPICFLFGISFDLKNFL